MSDPVRLDDAALREQWFRAEADADMLIRRIYKSIGAAADEAIVLDEDAKATIAAYVVALRDAARADVKGQRDELARQLKSAVTVLARHGFCEHAGTWISREEADRISKDGP